MNNRLESLDYLRGLAAISIMIYHLSGWNISIVDSKSYLGILGVYGVAVFFILSGLSMALVYNKNISDIKTSLSFFSRRLFRIIPLLCIVATLTVIPIIIEGKFDWKLYVATITTLFGFIKPNAYCVTGGWSIGNEMVYYSLTPIILIIYNKRKTYGNIVLLISLVIGGYFAIYVLNPNVKMSEQWIKYINPFNNMYFYILGIAIYYNFRNIKINQSKVYMMFIAGIAMFLFYPVNTNNTASGWERLIFSIISLIIVFSFYKVKIENKGIIHKILEKFGIATYGVYLIHPVVNLYANLILKKFDLKINNILLVIIMIGVTITVSIISYYKFEILFIQLGKSITKKYIIKQETLKSAVKTTE